MLEVLKSLIIHQSTAALDTLKYCIEACPDSDWQEAHKDSPFSQVVFHALFYTDFYLGRDSIPFKDQPFHRKHKELFEGYEEMENRIPLRLYEKSFCVAYLGHCMAKLRETVASETEDTLAGASGIDFRKISRAELYVYTMRHIQHHAAQLALRIQQATGKETPWFSGAKAVIS